ncbi:MAG: long-chain fatty acid--CoA ligase [Proteobacteria bacterium]|nr:long-chain fatty acid--CoA ligase [Pseudomonadota bacterium]
MSIKEAYTPQEALTRWAGAAATKTIVEMFRKTEQRCANRTALVAKGWAHGTQISGGAPNWKGVTWRQLSDLVREVAAGLLELGVQSEDRVAHLTKNRPEWVMTDLGILSTGAVHVPVYPTLAADQVAYILNDAGARVVVVETQKHLDAILSERANIPTLEHVIVYDAYTVSGDVGGLKISSYDDLRKLGKERSGTHAGTIEERVAALTPLHVASIIYTSGTTGEPKGALLTHGNFVSNATTVVPDMGIDEHDRELCILPLCHVLERIAYYCMLSVGGEIWYAESIEAVGPNLGEVRPSVVPCVPRLFEKIHGRIIDGVEAGSALKKKIFYWAIGVGQAVRECKARKQEPGFLLSLQHSLATKLVFGKIHERVGGRLKFFLSGGAPLRKDIAEFFANVGITICEGYGLTETSPIITINRPNAVRFGSVGTAIGHVEVKIADDGEILARGPNIMLGYFNKAQATTDAIEAEGWFHTGDIGNVDAEGYLRITDRKKELLVMSNGKNVAPQPIENLLKSSNYVEQAVVIGDNRNFITALVFPTWTTLEVWAQGQGITAKGAALAKEPKVLEFLTKHVEGLCKELSQYERVKKISILENEMTEATGELTPTLKFKRRVILEKHKAAIEGMYGD